MYLGGRAIFRGPVAIGHLKGNVSFEIPSEKKRNG